MRVADLIKWFQSEYPYIVKEYKEADHNFSSQELNPFHLEGDTWSHLCMVMGIAEYLEVEEDLKLALFFHDLGKPMSMYRNEENCRVSFRGHEGISFWLAEDYLRRLEIPEKRKKRILSIISLHTELFKLFREGKFNEETFKKKFISNHQLVRDLASHAECDGAGRFFEENDEPSPKEFKKIFEEKIELLEERKLPYEADKEIIILSGLPCSGKSTWRKENSKGYTVVSIDDILEEWAEESGKSYDETWRERIEEAGKEFNVRLQDAFKRRENIIVDKTHMSPRSRNRSLGVVNKEYKKTCKLFVCGFDTILKRDGERKGKSVPFEHLLDQMRIFQIPTYATFDQVDWIFS